MSQDVDRVSLVETDSESGDGGIEMTFVYLQAFTARRRERNSWHELCNVHKAGFPWQKIARCATVGNQTKWCTGGAGETTTAAIK